MGTSGHTASRGEVQTATPWNPYSPCVLLRTRYWNGADGCRYSCRTVGGFIAHNPQERRSIDEPADDRIEHTWQSINDKHNSYHPPNGCEADSQGYIIDYHLYYSTMGSDSPP